jgi:heat shock protein HslJ
MNRSGTTTLVLVLPLLLVLLGSCTDPVVVIDEPEEVETCEWLIPVGIDLVNDYVYTLEETDLGPTRGDPDKLPASLVALNIRGEELDRRAKELDCDLDELNRAIADATAGIESSDPVVQAMLQTLRSGVVASRSATEVAGEWEFVAGTASGQAIEPAPDQVITLVVDSDGSATGSTGCNEYTISGNAGKDGLWPVDGYEQTAAPCRTDTELVAEEAYIAALQSVASYSIENETLTLSGADAELTYVRAPNEASAGDATEP